MPRSVLVLALFVLLVSGEPVLAGPPEGVSGKMVFDEVADGLLRCRDETDREKLRALLERLARTRDPRVAILLGEKRPGGAAFAFTLLARYYRPGPLNEEEYPPLAGLHWWEENEADLRRRAKKLP
jgi:hypothetical protein